MLSDNERKVKEIEENWWANGGNKNHMIRDAGFSPTHYYILLNNVINDLDTEIENPDFVRRLRRLQQQRHDERFIARR
ncbi:MAG: DUF3263 domain-containing protein [Actinomycetaceae bacterium]|nr:DUF3263 domain-containing protein [Actinomycetaceae bacterium]